MKISELIKMLEEIKVETDDLEVRVEFDYYGGYRGEYLKTKSGPIGGVAIKENSVTLFVAAD